MLILGISCYYHDAAAVLLKDGRVVAAAEEERFSRKKHDSDFPRQAIEFCLKQSNLKGSDLDYAVFYEKPFRKLQRILFTSLAFYPWALPVFVEAMRVWLTKKLWIREEISTFLKLPQEKILFCEHHLSHAASCFYPSPFGEAAILTIDGVGEWTTTAAGWGKKNQVKLVKEIYFPHSIGLLYSTFTAFLGFEVNEGEWKVMGLAPFGKPKYVDRVWRLVKMFNDGSFSLDFSYFDFPYSETRSFSDKFIKLFGKPIPPAKSHLVEVRAADIAASIQVVTEELLLSLAKKLHQETRLKNLCLSGGVALNSVANFRLLKESGFQKIYIQPAAGDSGGALGAALYVHHQVLGHKKNYTQTHSYLGHGFTNSEIKKFLRKNKLKANYLSQKKLIDYIVDKLQKNKVVGWFKGRFEWGPRALGARSILADPRNPNMKDIINSKVKFREAFRPFAPSILAEKATQVFEIDQKTVNEWPFRFMLYVVPVKKEWQHRIPAITHIDKTARPQLVDKKINPLYHQLILEFYKKTGVPLILNTSFNLRGEPIVATPEDAYSTFMRSGIDILVLENYIMDKSADQTPTDLLKT